MSWSTDKLQALVEAQTSWVVEAEGDCLNISNDEGIDAFAYVGSRQIIVEAALFAAASVKDTAALNNFILHTHQLMPLTTVCINTIDGEDYYIAFGALSVDSKDGVIIEEIETLFDNVTEFLDLYNEHLKMEAVA